MHAAMTTTRGSNEDMHEVGVMVAEAMDEWFREMEGFLGLLLLNDEATGTTQVISFWESEEIAESRRHARLQFRDRITASVNVEVDDTVGYDVAYARFPAGDGRRPPEEELTEQELAQLLRDAERAHGEYERTLGERDEDWPSWYARHLLGALRTRGT